MLTAPPKRHTLLRLTESGLDQVWANRETLCPGGDAWADIWPRFRGLPVITRRQVSPGEAIPVGLSLPVRRDGVRCRLSSSVPADEVASVISPIQAAELCAGLSLPISAPVSRLLLSGPSLGIAVGLFGSTALEAVTGLPYRHAGSDLDVLLIPEAAPEPAALAELCRRLAREFQLSIDAELALGGERYVKLNELCSGSRTVLIKGGPAPVLCSTRAVLASLGSGGKSILKK